MVDEPGPEPVAEPVWLPIPDAARRLGISPQAVRKRIGRGTLESRRDVQGNRTRTVVRIPATVSETGSAIAQEMANNRDETVALLRERVARLEERLTAAEEAKAEFRAERDHLRVLVERLMAERRPERRPWPGIRAWWRWLVEGGGSST